MKTIKLYLTIFTFSCLTTLSLGQTAEKTFVKSFNLEGQQIVILDLDGEIDVQRWEKDIMRIQMHISIPNFHTGSLKSLVQAGRYNLKSKVANDQYTIYAPGMEREVKIKGTKIDEAMSFIVYAPNGVEVRLANEASTSAEDIDSKPTSL